MRSGIANYSVGHPRMASGTAPARLHRLLHTASVARSSRHPTRCLSPKRHFRAEGVHHVRQSTDRHIRFPAQRLRHPGARFIQSPCQIGLAEMLLCHKAGDHFGGLRRECRNSGDSWLYEEDRAQNRLTIVGKKKRLTV
jgi:hypothetical protein